MGIKTHPSYSHYTRKIIFPNKNSMVKGNFFPAYNWALQVKVKLIWISGDQLPVNVRLVQRSLSHTLVVLTISEE
nr:hypothetical protein JUJ52_20815 [Virgibacillus sp. AGTR]